MGKLLAIDGFTIVRRIYEANTDPDMPDRAEAALRQSLFAFKRLVAAHQPTHVLSAFDAEGPTWRHELHPGYRESGSTTPPDLKEHLPDFYGQLNEIGLNVLSPSGVDSDDVIATAVLRWLNENRGAAIIASNDKDLYSLLAHGAQIWDYFKGEWHDSLWVEEKFGVPPDMMNDWLALTGDAAAGIPGVTKVGTKTAAKLLHSYKNLDGIMAGAGILITPLGERLRREREQLALSRRLVELKTDVTLGVSWKMLAYGPGSSA